MIEKINNNPIQNNIENSLQTNEAKKSLDPAVSLQTDFGALLEQAKQIPPQEEVNIEEIKKLLSEGKIDTPENILASAENIVTYGI